MGAWAFKLAAFERAGGSLTSLKRAPTNTPALTPARRLDRSSQWHAAVGRQAGRRQGDSKTGGTRWSRVWL